MSEKIDFPNNRLTAAGLGKPIFGTDIQNSTENLLQAIYILLGLPSNGFAILSGFTYTPGTPGSYSSGIVYMNGQIYLCSAGLQEGKYLAPNVQDLFPKLHNPDGNSYPTYRVYYAVSSNSQVGGMPQFSGNMDQYRISSYLIQTALNNLISSLGTASTKDFGAGAGELPQIGDGISPGNYVVADLFGSDNHTALTSKTPAQVRGDIVGENLLTKIIDIGTWSVPDALTKTISHGISDFSKIRNISAILINNTGDYRFEFIRSSTTLSCNSAAVILTITSGGDFDDSEFSGTSANRGFIIIRYIP